MIKRAIKTRNNHIVVGIGASAGGLEAINAFFDNIKVTPDHSYVIIQHLSSDHKSFLVELVAKHTSMEVIEAKNKLKVRKKCVYVIPNKMMMTIENGKLQLLEKTTENVPNNAIDIFLKSLAGDYGENAVAVILSGTGTDGSRGIDAIKTNGGTVLVQEPATAKFDGMPNSAILTGNVDIILPPEKMPSWILNRQQETIQPLIADTHVSEAQMATIFDILQRDGGYDFHYYKTPTIIRRISKRMGMLHCASLDAYIQLLSANKEEAIELSKELFINVTSFFRDTEVFKAISTTVIPALFNTKKEDDVIKIWVCACSTGEEAYSYAMLFDRYLQKTHSKVQVKIFATDIDENNIAFAGKNSYPSSVAASIPEDMLKDYFIFEHNRYSVIPRIRKQIVFAKHNIIKDPAFIKNDLISCRNMLIYMNKVLQEKIMGTFHFSLNEAGYLVLGSSESAGILKDAFTETDGRLKIYTNNKKKQGVHNRLSPGTLENIPKYRKTEKQSGLIQELSRDFQYAITEHRGYTAIYIDKQYDIKETIGNFSKYLSLPKQRLKLNLLAMLPIDLEIVLSNAIKRSWQGNKTVFLKRIPFQAVKGHHVDVMVKPASDPAITMIILSDATVSGSDNNTDTISSSNLEGQLEYVKELESQLTDTRDNLQLAIEGLETTNEELQSANEELLSSNEELQSSNEELQSLNEELHTLNTEHQAKIKELIELNDDLDNYFRSTEIGQVLLDADLNIRKFNPNSRQFVNLIDGDIGRPMSHISNNLQYEGLQGDILKVNETGKMLETEISLQNGRVTIVRIYPYIRKDKIVDGVVLTFMDVTDVKNLYSVVNGVFESSLNAIIVLTSSYDIHQNKIIDFDLAAFNHAAETLLGDKKENIAGKSFKKMASHLLQYNTWDKLVKVADSGISDGVECNYIINGTAKFYDLSIVKMNDGVMITYNDITQKKNAEKRLKKNYNELIITRESLKGLNMRLEEEVAERTRELTLSEERFRLVSRATNDVIKDWDLVINKVWLSGSFYSLFQYSMETATENVDFWFQQIHPADVQQVKEGIFNAINSGDLQWIGEYRFRNGSGDYGYVMERGYILKDEAGMPYRLISSIMDITTLKKAEEATKELLQQKDEFMSIASHELKTPITSMKASLQIVERILTEKDSQVLAGQFINKANEQVDKLTVLVENLLDVTKIQSGKMEFSKSEFDISRLISESVYHIRNLSRSEINIAANDVINIYADQNRIEQVIINLLSNALKYSPDTTVVILKSYVTGHKIKVEVTDQGIGIPSENLPFIFDRFFRGIHSSEKFSGLGLGLYISADIIKRHGGEIGVQSILGKGSTFWFTLPLGQNTHTTTK